MPIGSGDWVRRIVLEGVASSRSEIAGFDVVSNPKFLREGSAIVDGRNYLDARSLATAGFDYIGIGRPTVDRVAEDLPDRIIQIDDLALKSAA